MQIYKDCVAKITQGGGVAAPIAGQVLGEVLPYLEVKKSEEETQNISMPNVVGMTLEEAKQILDEFEIQVETEDFSNDSIISKQIPEEGITIEFGTNVILYCE